MLERDESDQLSSVRRDLEAEFATFGVTAAEIDDAVQSAFDEYRDAPVRQFVPMFVHRRARDRLRDLVGESARAPSTP